MKNEEELRLDGSSPDYKSFELDRYLEKLKEWFTNAVNFTKSLKMTIRGSIIATILLFTIFIPLFYTQSSSYDTIPQYSNYNINVHIEGIWDPDGKGPFLETEKEFDVEYWSNDIRDVPRVSNRRLLSKVNVTDQIINRDTHHMAVTDDMINTKYVDLELKTYLSNLEIDTHQPLGQMCKSYEFKDNIQYSPYKVSLQPHLDRLRSRIIKDDVELSKLIQRMAENHSYDERAAIARQMFTSSTVIVWSKTYYCYFAYTRVVFSELEDITKPDFTVISAQAYNRYWDEVPVPVDFIDQSKPSEYNDYMESIEKDYGVDKNCIDMKNDLLRKCIESSSCKTITDNELKSKCEEEKCEKKIDEEIKRCEIDVSEKKELAKDKQDIAKKKFTLSYPLPLEIPHNYKTSPQGAEHIRSVMRENTDGRMEPLLFYSLNVKDERDYFFYLPDRYHENVILLQFKDKLPDTDSSNWIPFVHRQDGGSSLTKGSVHLITSMSPLMIYRCTLDDGECVITHDASELGTNVLEHGSTVVKGGTNFMALPEMVPEMKDRNIWVSISSIVVEQCFDGQNSSKPVIVILEEHKGMYNLLSVSSIFDYELEGSEKGEETLLTLSRPDSIISWDARVQDDETLEFEDYMQVTMGNGHSHTGSTVIRIKGILKYILRSFQKPELQDELSFDDDLRTKLYGNALCAKIDIARWCAS